MMNKEISFKIKRKRFGYGVLWFFVLFCGLNFFGFQLLMGVGEGWFISWHKLTSPPVSISELAPPWSYVRVMGTDNLIYGKQVYDIDRLSEPWFTEDRPVPEEADRYSPVCTLDDLPFSLFPTRPTSLQDCRKFEVHVEARYSYVVLDEEQQLWVWVNSYSGMVEGLWYARDYSFIFAHFISHY